jgi:hypothetical protein
MTMPNINPSDPKSSLVKRAAKLAEAVVAKRNRDARHKRQKRKANRLTTPSTKG